jgi:hypothetical protein
MLGADPKTLASTILEVKHPKGSGWSEWSALEIKMISG